ncbi:MAG: hypothetical protein NXI13_11940 [Proteobacteria bacterium]|nr:hypothetical protein [Pseudomonadota bacterium]
MKFVADLNEDQRRRIAATLDRIRAGLMEKKIESPGEEPAPVFVPEAFDAFEK